VGPLIVVLFALTDNGMHGPLCGRVRAKRGIYCRDEVPEVGRLVGTTSAGAWRHTLGMSALSNHPAASPRLFSQDGRPSRSRSAFIQASEVQFTPTVTIRQNSFVV